MQTRIKRIKQPFFLCTLLLFCTGCGRTSEIPPVELIQVPAITVNSAAEETDAPAETQPEETPAPETEEFPETDAAESTSAAETAQPETDGTDSGTEETTETTQNISWVKAYRAFLSGRVHEDAEEETDKTADSAETTEDEDWTDEEETDSTESAAPAYFALIYLDADAVPELVILEDVSMELYFFNGETAELLIEDSYKSDAIAEQNVCYQPETGLFSSAFSTMSGGDGFTIYDFEEFDAVHAERYYFNNIENIGGEMAYNEIWKRAKEFQVRDGGYHNVTLGNKWVHIGTDFPSLYRLNAENAETLKASWAKEYILPEQEEDDFDYDHPYEETTEEDTDAED